MAGRRWIGIGVGAAALAALGGLGWLGLQVSPAALPPGTGGPVDREMAEAPSTLPPPVARFAHRGLGGNVSETDSAVITGRGHLTLAGITFPARFRFIEQGGRNYRHYIECTWFGIPLLKVNEWYLDGHLRQQLPGGVVAGNAKLDEAANVALWGEMVWLPSILLTNPQVRWEPIDDRSARLAVPSGSGEDALTVTFNAETGLIESMTALRYRSATDAAKTPWRVDLADWTAFHGVRAPSSAAITWLDQGKPWFMMQIEDVAYNSDVSQLITGSGL